MRVAKMKHDIGRSNGPNVFKRFATACLSHALSERTKKHEVNNRAAHHCVWSRWHGFVYEHNYIKLTNLNTDVQVAMAKYAGVVWTGFICMILGFVFAIASVATDQYVEVAYKHVDSNETVRDMFGIFTWLVDHDKGMYNGSVVSPYYMHCDGIKAYESTNVKTSNANDGCKSQCHIKQAFAVISIVTGIIATLAMMDVKHGSWKHMWIHRETYAFRVIAGIMGLFAFFSTVIVLSLIDQEMGDEATLRGSGSTQVYSESMGVCAYKIKKDNSNTVVSFNDPRLGISYMLLILASILYGLATVMISTTYLEDSAIDI